MGLHPAGDNMLQTALVFPSVVLAVKKWCKMQLYVMETKKFFPQWNLWWDVDMQPVWNIFHIYIYIPRRKSGIYWIQVRRAAAAAVEISLWTR